MLLKDYIQKCLIDDEFSSYWSIELDKIVGEEPTYEFESLTTSEALSVLEADSLDTIIKNKGIHSGIKAQTSIEFYEKNNKCQVADFLDSIYDEKLKAKTLLNIVNLSMAGRNARPPLSKYIDDGMYELRSKQSNNITRIFYFFVVGNKIVLTNGYIKKDQKLDKEEFERAKKYRNEYLRRRKH